MLKGVMPLERTVRRYTAYFRGWCQAFGEHEFVAPQDEGISYKEVRPMDVRLND